nr:inactive peptidyl-prolyl cis-trans isomerase FKBP6-like [Lytechinus pictus]
MESVELDLPKLTEYDDDDDIEKYDEVRVELNKGLVLNDLKTEGGAHFEVKPPPDLPDPDTDAYFETEEVFKQLNRECLGDDGDNDDEGLSPFEKMAKKMEDITPEKNRKVLKSYIKQGAGALPIQGMTLTVHYNCYVEYSDEPYDSTRLRNKPERIKLGKGDVFLSVELALSSMRKGEISRFLIHPDLAFKDLGVPPRIPANATILMEIEVLNCTDRAELDEFNNMSEEERKEITFKRKLKVVYEERTEGNELFNDKKYKQALSKYMRCLRILEGAHLRNQEEEDQMRSVHTKICLNIALCSSKLKTPERVISYCNRVLAVDPKNPKALYRKGMAQMELRDFRGAHVFLTKAQQQEPSNAAILSGLRELNKAWRQWNLMERTCYGNMFPDWKKDDQLKEGEKSQRKIPENVQKNIRDKLRDFQEAKKKNEMTFQAKTMAPSEINFLETVAKEFSMTFQKREYQGEQIIKIVKKAAGKAEQ